VDLYAHTHHIHMFRSAPAYLFRGARLNNEYGEEDEPGADTPTTVDPIVATSFAARQKSKGSGYVLILSKKDFADKFGGPSTISHAGLELAVNLALHPKEVEEKAVAIIPVEKSVEILAAMGFELPSVLYSHPQLHSQLQDSQRMLPEQIEEYFHRVMDAIK
jgi:hypothetical protein